LIGTQKVKPNMNLRILLFSIASFFTSSAFAQNFTGQWKGSFVDNSTKFMTWGGDRCDYVLELETKGLVVTGYSYTYFTDGEKRYYTICKLKGTINKASHSVEVREYERTKTNVPQNIHNCFQVHKLTYFKQGEDQTLEGSWIPAPDQEGDCGYGTTLLSRRVLKNINTLANITKPKKSSLSRTPVAQTKKPNTQATALLKPKTKVTLPPPVAKTTIPKKPVVKEVIRDKPWLTDTPPVTEAPAEITIPKKVIDNSFEKRNSTLIRTIEVEHPTVKVDLYDNGDIDGDSISVFLNDKLLLSHRRLSDKAITLNLDVTNDEVNELVMYAENLGSIPPNTALMVVTDGDKRYEVRISSDLQKSGAIRFVHKSKTGQ
jgi:hypothetical protein